MATAVTKGRKKAPKAPEPAPPKDLGNAHQLFVRQLPDEQKQAGQAEVVRFVRWLGPERALTSVTPPEIGEYSDLMAARGTAPDSRARLSTVKAFLAYLKKKEYIDVNLAQHMRLKKTRLATGRRSIMQGQEVVRLTKAGHAELSRKLEGLQADRIHMAAQIHTAALDKDVRENAPLEAARQEQGRIMARIVDIQATLNAAVIIDAATNESDVDRVSLGSRVKVKDSSSGKVVHCQLVEPREANPLSGKISNASPVGNAIMGSAMGDEVQVEAPGGTQSFEIIDIS